MKTPDINEPCLPITAFLESSCELNTPARIFLAIYGLTNGHPCPGCAYDMHGKCKARRELFKAPEVKAPIQEPTETVRQTAERLGMSISEVRRQRRMA